MKIPRDRTTWLLVALALGLGLVLGGAFQETRATRVQRELDAYLSELERLRKEKPPPLPPSQPASPEAVAAAERVIAGALKRGAWTREDGDAWAKASLSLDAQQQQAVLEPAVRAVNGQALKLVAPFP